MVTVVRNKWYVDQDHEEFEKSMPKPKPTTVLEVIFFLIVTSCGGPAVYFATVNVTALEYNLPQLNEYVEISDQVFCPIGPHFYDMRSSWTNFKQVLGRNWLQRLFLPVRGDVDWKMLAYDPVLEDVVVWSF